MLFFTLSCPTTRAAPALLSPWPSIVLVNPNNSRYLRDTADEKLIWVKPPTMGAIDTGKGEPSAHPNHQLCENLTESMAGILDQEEKFDRLLREIESYDTDVLSDTRQLEKIYDQRARYISTAIFSIPAKAIVALTDKIVENSLSLKDASLRLESCESGCELLSSLNSWLETQGAGLMSQFDTYNRDYPEMAKTIMSYASELLRVRESSYFSVRSKETSMDYLMRMERRLLRSFAKKAVLAGGFQDISYRLGWKEAIANLAKSNPDYSFKAMPIRSLRLRARLVPEKIDDFYLATAPLFIGFEGSGLVALGDIDPKGPFSDHPLTKIKGRFHFSLAGACPLLHPPYRDAVKGKVKMQADGIPVFGAILTYSYLVELPETIKGRYHPKRLYDLLKKAAGKEEFYSLKTQQGLLDSSALDGAIELPESTQPATAMAIRRELVDRVMAAMTIPQSKSPAYSQIADDFYSPNCNSYSCFLASWTALDPAYAKQAEANLSRLHNKWTPIAIDGKKLTTFTDISVFGSK